MKRKDLAFRVLLALGLVLLLALPTMVGAQEPEPNDPPPEALPFEPETPIAAVSSADLTVTPGVVPDSVLAVLGLGESVVVDKTVTLPEVPPKLDLVLMVDLSGSYINDLPNIKSKAPNIFTGIRNQVADSQFGLTTFVDYPFYPWGASYDYAYRLDQDLTTDQTTWLNAINAMATRSGSDWAESQYVALYQAATGAGQTVDGYIIPAGEDPSWRDGVTRVIAITTDAGFHNAGDSGYYFPYPGPTRDATVAALNAASIKVIAIKAPGATVQMDDVAAATGGAVTYTGNTSAEIVEAILGALEELTFTVTPVPVGCGPLQFTFDPASHTGVEGGESVNFVETITVPPDTPPGIYDCQVDFQADGTVVGTESVSIVVYDPSAGFVTGGGWIESPAGAYTADSELAGMATFGFVSKYDRRTSTPEGETEFHFEAASNFKFHSDTYEWLAVAPEYRAMYQGSGTVWVGGEEQGSYSFRLTAIDGELDGTGEDKFRIRIWGSGGGVIYDNENTAGEYDDPTTVVHDGNIIVHTIKWTPK